MSSRWRRAFTEGYEAGYGGESVSDIPYKTDALRAEWERGWYAGIEERNEAIGATQEEQEWRDLVLAPLAERFDATTEVMEEFVDMLVNVIARGKRI